ncbi:MAG: DnaD domain protein [Halanaerobium sp.]
MEHNFYKEELDFTEKESRQVLSISDTVIDKGFLRKFSGSEVKLLLYLLTHRRKENLIKIELPLAAAALGMNLKELKNVLKSLRDKSILANEEQKNSHLFSYNLELKQLFNNNFKEKEHSNAEELSASELRRQVIKTNIVSEKEIAAALISFLPPAQRNIHRREEIKGWLDDFELKMLKELVRRVNKWLERQGGGDYLSGSFAYLRAIVESWYQEGITTYEKLQEQDKLHRETRELARAYGINSFSSDTAQLKTFQSWITGEQALSKELALAAIREAVRRKRDGQPSLKYVEDNFINPIKELGINNLGDFKRWLQKEMDHQAAESDSRDQDEAYSKGNNTKKDSEEKAAKNKKSKKKNRNSKDDVEDYKWKDFFIDFDKYKE